MSIPWVCTTCRRHLQGVKLPVKAEYRQRAAFISFASNDSTQGVPHGQAIRQRSAKRPQTARPRKRHVRLVPSDYSQSVEDDFVERVLESRDPSAGPYSNPASLRLLIPDSRGETHPQDVPDVPRSGIFKADTRPRPTHRVINPKPIPYDHTAHKTRPLRSQLALNPFLVPTHANDALASLEQAALPDIDHASAAELSDYNRDRRKPSSDGESSDIVQPATERDGARSAEEEKAHIGNRSRVLYSVDELRSSGVDEIVAQTKSPTAYNDGMIALVALEPYMRNPTAGDRYPLTRKALLLTNKVIHHWYDAEETRALPSPVDLFQRLCKDRIPFRWAQLWREIVMTLLTQTRREHPTSAGKSSKGMEELSVQITYLWCILFEQYGECHRFGEEGVIEQVHNSHDWTLYTSSEQMRRILDHESSHLLHERLGSFLDSDIARHLTEADGLSAVMTLALLQREHSTLSRDPGERQNPFEDFLANLTAGIDLSLHLDQYRAVLQSRKRHAVDKVLADIQSLVGSGNTAQKEDAQHSASAAECKPSVTADDEPALILSFTKRIGRAIERQAARSMDGMWAEAQHTFLAEGRTALPPTLFVHFLKGFMAIRHADKAVTVWNVMLQQGVEPTTEHWDAMLKGCGLAKDPHSLQALWVKMMQSGSQPDNRIWATRIQGLVENRQCDEALQAFEDMAHAWKSTTAPKRSSRKASKPEVDTFLPPKPNAHCLNILINGLAKRRRYDQLVRALSWLRPLRLQPDIYTFNPLFRSALADGEVSLATTFLERMHGYGIEPNAATFTMILSSLFENRSESTTPVAPEDNTEPNRVNSASPQGLQTEQASSEFQLVPHLDSATGDRAIGSFFSLMAKHSVQPTAYTYSTLITGLLKMERPNITAAYAVLKHLAVNSLPISPQIYTSLAQYHFKQCPPDLESIEALWHHAKDRKRRSDVLVLDNTFFNLFIAGWCQTRQYGRALRGWQSAARDGRSLSYETYQALGEGLARSGNRAQATIVVQEVEKQERERGIHTAGRVDRAEFWSWARFIAIKDTEKPANRGSIIA